MKKLEKALLALLLLAGMGGCTKKEAPSQETVKNKTKVCASINREDAKAETLVEIELKAAFAELADTLPTELSFYNVSKDQAAQNTAVDTMLKESCAAVIIELVDIAAAQPIMEKLQAAGLPLIYIESDPGDEILNAYADKSTYIGLDIQKNYVLQGEIVASLPNTGNINGDDQVSAAILSVSELSIENQNALLSAVAAKGVRAEILEAAVSENDREKGKEAAARLLKRYGDGLDVVFAESEALALGAADAISAAGRENGVNIYLISGEDSQAVRNFINDTLIEGSLWDDVEARAKAAAESVKKALKGESLGLKTLITNKLALKG